MKIRHKYKLYKASILVTLCSISPINRFINEQWSYDSAPKGFDSSFESKIVDGLTVSNCQDITPYNLVFMPYMSDGQKAEFSKNCQKVLPKNNSASLKETVYNLSKLKGFGQSSASKIAKSIWGDYER